MRSLTRRIAYELTTNQRETEFERDDELTSPEESSSLSLVQSKSELTTIAVQNRLASFHQRNLQSAYQSRVTGKCNERGLTWRL